MFSGQQIKKTKEHFKYIQNSYSEVVCENCGDSIYKTYSFKDVGYFSEAS